MTPLATRSWAGQQVQFKLEAALPSGSFKDRGATVLIHHLASLGVREVLEDSSGNGGAAIAAFAAAAGMRCHIYVPASTSEGKLVQLQAYGAIVHRIPGSRQATAEAAEAAAHDVVYASHNWQPLFIEGVKTVAFEIWEQRGFEAPDAIIVPTSFGSNLLGLSRGFRELLASGEIDRLPRLYPVQAAAVPPLDRFMRDGVRGVDPRQTVAEGVAGTHPIRLEQMAAAVRESGGRVVLVEEEDILPTLAELARSTGIYLEPTSAIGPAAARALIEAGEIAEQEDVVVIATGSGLKATERIGAYFEQADIDKARGVPGGPDRLATGSSTRGSRPSGSVSSGSPTSGSPTSSSLSSGSPAPRSTTTKSPSSDGDRFQ